MQEIPLNIMIFTDTYTPKIDGIAISIENFCSRLARRGHHFLICCPRYEKNDPVPAGRGIEVVRFRNFSLPSYEEIKVAFPMFRRLRRAIKDFRPDIIHIQTPGLMGIYGILAAKLYRIPLIGTYHTLVSEQSMYLSPLKMLRLDRLALTLAAKKKATLPGGDNARTTKKKTQTEKIVLKLCNWLYDRCDVIISPSQLIKNTLVEQGIKKPVVVVSNGMDLRVFKGPVKKHPHREPRLLHVGRISFEKYCDVVLKAFAIIVQDMPGATLTVVGNGPALESLRQLAVRLGINESVNFTGFVRRRSLPRLYRKFDLFITASTMETQGLVVLEAIASGLPCVGVDAYALPELIHHGVNGYIAPSYDHETMAGHVLAILQDMALYESFSSRSIRIAARHDIMRCTDRLESLYLEHADIKDLPMDNTGKRSATRNRISHHTGHSSRSRATAITVPRISIKHAGSSHIGAPGKETGINK